MQLNNVGSETRLKLILGIALSSSIGMVSIGTVIISEAVAKNSPTKRLIAQSIVDEEVNLKLESSGCRRTKTTQVSCDVVVTNLASQRQEMRFSVNNSAIPATTAIASAGTVYAAQRAESGDKFSDLPGSNGTACGCFNISLASNIPTKVTFSFEIPSEVTELAALDIGYWWYKDSSSSGVSKRTAISKIGTIAL